MKKAASQHVGLCIHSDTYMSVSLIGGTKNTQDDKHPASDHPQSLERRAGLV